MKGEVWSKAGPRLSYTGHRACVRLGGAPLSLRGLCHGTHPGLDGASIHGTGVLPLYPAVATMQLPTTSSAAVAWLTNSYRLGEYRPSVDSAEAWETVSKITQVVILSS